MGSNGELNRRGVSISRVILLASATAALVFIVAFIWMVFGDEDSPPPAALFYAVGSVYALLMVGLAYWLLVLAGDPSVAQRGNELQSYGVKTCPDLILQLDDALRVVALNPAAERRFRYSGHAVRGMPLSFLVTNLGVIAKRADVVVGESKAGPADEEAVLAQARELALRAGNRLTALAQPLFGYTELALQGLPPQHAVQGDIEEIGRSASRVVMFAQTLELFGGSTRVDCRPLDLNSLLEDLKEDLAVLLAPGTRVRLNRSPQPVIVDADARLTRLAALILACNAEESMPPNSSISISVGDSSLRVSDEGMGLPDTMRSSLFKPLASTKDPERGVGLGLVAARAAMRLQNAELQVVRSNSAGTVMSMVFSGQPADAPAAEAAPADLEAVAAPSSEQTS